VNDLSLQHLDGLPKMCRFTRGCLMRDPKGRQFLTILEKDSRGFRLCLSLVLGCGVELRLDATKDRFGLRAFHPLAFDFAEQLSLAVPKRFHRMALALQGSLKRLPLDMQLLYQPADFHLARFSKAA
jgi:hypothetical protein